MDELDPDRGWLVNGAKFIKTRNGKNHSLDSLHEIFNNLERERRNSPYFRVFVERRIGDTLTLDQTTLLEVEFSTGTGLRA